MRVVIQRVTRASVSVPDQGYEAGIGAGLLVLAAFIDEDTDEDIAWTARKIAGMRIFDDAEGVMNLSVMDVGGADDIGRIVDCDRNKTDNGTDSLPGTEFV